MSDYILELGHAARQASSLICRATTEEKNSALKDIGDEIVARRAALMKENEKDLIQGRDNGLSEPMLDRLTFDGARFDSMIEGLHKVAGLEDPIGEISDLSYQPTVSYTHLTLPTICSE